MLSGLAACPALALGGRASAVAALEGLIEARLPGVALAGNPGLGQAVAAHGAAGRALLAGLAVATNPAAVLARAAAAADQADCLLAGGWVLARFDLVLLAAREAAG
jgi:hypothetical protein